MSAARLTAKQKRFVAEYLVDGNATQAAIRAGYSKATAYSIGAENLKKPEIAAAIEAAQAKIAGKLGITAERVIQRVALVSDKALADGAYPAVLKAEELLARSLKDANPFSETVNVNATVASKEPDLPELARKLAFLLTSGVQAHEEKSP